jgi:recombination protein RecA
MGGNFEKAMAAIEKKIGKKNETIIYDPKRPVVSASSGCVIVDSVSGVGGLLVKRRMVEVFGKESSGKTTICLQSAAEAQRKGWVGAFIDVEQAYDATYAKALGLKLDNNTFIVIQPQFAEEAEMAIDLLLDNATKLDYILIDGIAAMKPRQQIESEDSTGKGQVKGAHAMFMSNWMPKINILAQQHDIAILFTNQMRRKMQMGGMFAPQAVRTTGLGTGYSNDATWTTTGGETVPYYMSMRFLLDFRKGYKEVVNGEEVKVANIITISNVKNKLSEPYKKADLMIRYGYGTDDSIPVFLALQDYGYITKKPNTSQYTYENEDTKITFMEKSQDAFLEKLVNTPKYWADALKLYKELMETGSEALTAASGGDEDDDEDDEEDLEDDDE